MDSPRLYPVHICCNDPDDGSMSRNAYGIVLKFSVWHDFELGGGDCTFSHVEKKPHTLRLGRREYPYQRMKPWVGNWCWNAYYLRPVIAAKLVGDLMRDGRWQNEGGLVEACEAWDRKDVFGFMKMWSDELFPKPKDEPSPAPGASNG